VDFFVDKGFLNGAFATFMLCALKNFIAGLSDRIAEVVSKGLIGENFSG
jgi:hypothetical protein